MNRLALSKDILKDGALSTEIVEKQGQQYKNATPFPHIKVDGLFDDSFLEKCVDELNQIGKQNQVGDFHGANKKFYQSYYYQFQQNTQKLLIFLNSSDFLKYLEKITGIEGLIPDPHYNGGGYHEIKRGGFLKMHTDFNWHRKLKLDRRVNLLLYLNKGWEESWGGELAISNSKLKDFKKYLPIFNRMVIFSTTDHSFHGHPDPLNCPEDKSRKSIALYYYTNGRPKSETFRGKNGSTRYLERKNDNFNISKFKTISKNIFERLPGFIKRILGRNE